MKEKILAFLKTKLAGFAGGIQDSFLNGIAESYSRTITDDTKIVTDISDAAIDAIKAAYLFNQSESDRRAKEAVKTYQTKHGLDENGQPLDKDKNRDRDKDKDKDKDNDPNNIQKLISDAVTAAVKPLQDKITAQEKRESDMALSAKVKSHEKIKGIPSWYLNSQNLIPESEDKIDLLVTAIETGWNTTRQQMVEEGVVVSPPPASAGGTKEGAEKGKEIAENRNKNVSDGVVGKKV